MQQHVHELEIENVELRAYYGQETVESQLYRDGGEGYEYQDGAFQLHVFTTKSGPNSFRIDQALEGELDDELATFEIKVFGLPFTPEQLFIDGVPIQIIDKEENAYVVVAPADFVTVELKG